MARYPDLVNALRRGLVGKSRGDGPRPEIHVSDLAVGIDGSDGKCARQLWLRLQGALEAAPHAGQRLMWSQGYSLQDQALEWLAKGLAGEWRIQATEGLLTTVTTPVAGRADCLLAGPDGMTCVVDFKTVRGRAFSYLTGPKPANVLQVQAYCLGLDATFGALVYIDREGQNFAREFFVERDDGAVLQAVSEAKRIQALVDPPPVMEAVLKKGKKALPWQCEYCSYYEVSCPGADVTGIDAALAAVNA